MQAKVIGILESRTGEHLAGLLARRGAVPLSAPALEEVPDIAPGAVLELVRTWQERPFRAAIFQTGVGTRALFDTADVSGCTGELLRLLAATVVVVRGPKPAGELNARAVRIDLKAAAPFTTETVLDALAGIGLEDSTVLVQRYGAANQALHAALALRGAGVREIVTYRWGLPADLDPLKALLRALAAARVDAVVFTSAIQIQHLLQVALGEGLEADALAALLAGPVIASIGPVCSRALRAHGIEPAFEASPPKLGPLLEGLERALGASARD